MARSGKTITFATDLLPNEDDTYNLGTTEQRWKIHGDIQPIVTKTYTNVIATLNSSNAVDQNTGGFFYGKVRATSYNVIWHTKIRITASVPNNVSYYATSIYDLWGVANTYLSYKCQNAIRSTSYRPVYYNTYFRVNSTGYNNGMGGWLGFSLLSSNEPTNTSLKRTVVVELLEYDNCTVELQDSLITPTNIPNRTTTDYYSSTNTSYDNFDFYQQGLRETGDIDANDTAGYIRHFQNGSYIKPTTAMGRYILLLDKGDGQHVIPVHATQASNNDDQRANTKSNLTTEAFNIFGPIEYYSTTTNIAANGNIDGRYHWTMRSDVDIRYSFNTGATLTAYKDVYIVATLQTPTTAKLRNPGATGTNAAATATGANAGPITQTLPTTEDNFIYIKLGHAYSTSAIILTLDHPIYYYKNGALHTYTDYADMAAKDGEGNTVSSTYLKLSGGTMTGGINLVGNQSNAWNDKGLVFTNGSRIGESNAGFGIYGAKKIYLRPNSPSSSSNIGLEIATNAQTTIATALEDTSANAILKLNSTTTNAIANGKYQWGIVHLANLAAGAATALATGQSDGTNNLAYFGFHYAGDGLDTNYAEIGFKGANNLVRVYPTGQVNITTNITSSSTSTGSLVVAGGAGITGNVYVGGTVCPQGNGTQNLGDTTHYWANVHTNIISSSSSLQIKTNTASSTITTVTFDGSSIIPGTGTSALDRYLGSSTYPWKTIFATTIYANNVSSSASSTLYLNSPASTSIIFTKGGASTSSEMARFDTDKNFVPKSTLTNTIGTSTINWTAVYSKKFIVESKVVLQWNSTDQSLDFVFV